MQRGVSQSICISDTHIFLKLSPSAYALCVSFFISKMDMIITRLSGSSSRRGDTCSAAAPSMAAPHPLPVPPLHHVPGDASHSISTWNWIWRLWERREMPALHLALFKMGFFGIMLPDHYLNIFRLLPQEKFRLPRLAAHLITVFHTCSCWQARDGHLPEIPWGHECALEGNEICVGPFQGNHESLGASAVTQLRRICPLCEFFAVYFFWIVSLLYFPFISKLCLHLLLAVLISHSKRISRKPKNNKQKCILVNQHKAISH